MFAKVLENIASAANVRQAGDYTENGLLYCGKCRTPKQAMIRQPNTQDYKPMPVMCACREKQLEAERAEQRRNDILIYREKVLGKTGAAQTFAADDRAELYATKVCMGYAASFDSNTTDGLLFCGGTGTGKTFLARAVLNAVADKGFSVMCTTVGQLERRLWDVRDKTDVFERISRTDLLLLDDLGAERQSPYMQQMVYEVLDCRLDARKPILITTNMTLEELRSPDTLEKRRSLSRVYGQTVIVAMLGADRRREKLTSTQEERLAAYYNAGERSLGGG